MNAFVRRHKILTVVIILAALLFVNWVWSLSASTRGRLAAQRDIRRGRYEVLGYGLPPASRDDYVRCLREQYGVQYRVVALCIVSESLVSYADSYNRVSSTAARQRFGRDIFQECAQEAERKWTDKRSKLSTQ